KHGKNTEKRRTCPSLLSGPCFSVFLPWLSQFVNNTWRQVSNLKRPIISIPCTAHPRLAASPVSSTKGVHGLHAVTPRAAEIGCNPRPDRAPIRQCYSL